MLQKTLEYLQHSKADLRKELEDIVFATTGKRLSTHTPTPDDDKDVKAANKERRSQFLTDAAPSSTQIGQ